MAKKKYAVIGLGHFGMNLALGLAGEGAEVIAIDQKEEAIGELSDKVTQAVCMDSTDEKALRKLGLEEMDAVIVAIGEGFESSMLTTAILQHIGVKKIFSRVVSPIHEKLLKALNVSELLYPEADSADRLARKLMIQGLLGSYYMSIEYGVFEIVAPKSAHGKKLIDLNLRNKYGLNLVTIKRSERAFGLISVGPREEVKCLGVPSPETIIEEGDILALFGKEKDIKRILEY